MENNENTIESLFEKASEYGKTSFELIKLRTLDKASHVGASIVSRSFVLIIVGTIALFINLGIAFWLGEILGKLFYGFFAVAVCYFVIFMLYLMLSRPIKRWVQNYFIKLVLK